MKNRILSLALILLIIFSFISTMASADGYLNLGSVYTGTAINYSVATVADGTTISCNDLPQGLNIQVYGNSIYVAGSVNTAGNYMFVINTSDPMCGNITCSVNVMPMVPALYTSSDVDCYVGDSALLSVSAGTSDGGALNYQWYYTSSPSGMGGAPIPGANGAELYADTSLAGTTYYYCVVGNGYNGSNTLATSNTIRVSVMSLQVESIMINTLPSSVVYESGQLKEITGLTIELNYGQGRKQVITEGFNVSAGSYDSNTKTLMLTVEYQGKYSSFPVSVTETEPQITGIGMVRLPDRQEYKVGEGIDGKGLIFRAYYANGTYTDLSDSYSLAPNVFTAAGTQTVTLFYKEKVCTFSVTVKATEELADRLEISSRPAKLSYNVGESVDTSGLVIRHTVSGLSTDISSGFTVEPGSFSQPGTQTVTIRYNGLSTSYTVDVKAPAATPAPTAPTPAAEKSDTVEGERKGEKSVDLPSLTSPGKSNKGLIVAVLILAILALGSLGIYLLIMENGGIEEIRYKIECAIYDLRDRSDRRK